MPLNTEKLHFSHWTSGTCDLKNKGSKHYMYHKQHEKGVLFNTV